jgi:hypothetical protein
MLLTEIITVYYKNYKRYINTLCGEMRSLLVLRKVVHISTLGLKYCLGIIVTSI